MKKWRLKAKEERRFKQGHPWVYSNELQESPKGVEPGELVQLQDASGNAIAVGFGNPHSLIAFRELGARHHAWHLSEIGNIFFGLIKAAFDFRAHWFKTDQSCRVVYGEVDGLPGLVVDRYVGNKIIYVVQPHSAGMDRHIQYVIEALKAIQPDAIAIIRKDAGSREREGLLKLPAEVIHLNDLSHIHDLSFLSPFEFFVPGIASEKVAMSADLIKGQKTGFFFDQLENIRLTGSTLARKLEHCPQKEVKILDLCSYVGQWGTQISLLLRAKGIKTSVTVVDASESALELAENNIKSTGAAVRKIKSDVLDPIPELEEERFDLVIADPPALIKSRKVIPQGKQAYVQLMAEAIRRTREQGLVVACSCSQLLSQEDFIEVLAKASRRSKSVRWLAQGSASMDHFQRFDFREGNYLKCFVGVANKVQ